MSSHDADGTGVSVISGMAVAGIDRRTAIDAVRQRIGTAVSLGLLRPGERLPDVDKVALGLSVSPITARRALTSLAEEGIVVRRRGRSGGTFVAGEPPADALKRLTVSPSEFDRVHTLVNRRVLCECAVTHFAAVNATPDQLGRLETLTQQMAVSEDWSDYHQLDEKFHRLVAEASGLDSEVNTYNEALTELYEHFIPYPIEQLHASNQDHIRLVDALKRRDVADAVDISRLHVSVLHKTMFMGLVGNPQNPETRAGRTAP